MGLQRVGRLSDWTDWLVWLGWWGLCWLKERKSSSSVPNICPWVTYLPRKKTFTWRWHRKADWLVNWQGNVDLNQTNMLEQIIDSGIWEIMWLGYSFCWPLGTLETKWRWTPLRMKALSLVKLWGFHFSLLKACLLQHTYVAQHMHLSYSGVDSKCILIHSV